MPSKKKKYNARFPAGRIKKIMQSDEEIGKVAQAVPIIISRTLELFVESLLTKTLKITNSRNAKTLSPSHMKQCIMSEQRFDFLRELVKSIPDISVAEEAAGYNEDDAQSSPEEQYPDSDTPYDLSMPSTSTQASSRSSASSSGALSNSSVEFKRTQRIQNCDSNPLTESSGESTTPTEEKLRQQLQSLIRDMPPGRVIEEQVRLRQGNSVIKHTASLGNSEQSTCAVPPRLERSGSTPSSMGKDTDTMEPWEKCFHIKDGIDSRRKHLLKPSEADSNARANNNKNSPFKQMRQQRRQQTHAEVQQQKPLEQKRKQLLLLHEQSIKIEKEQKQQLQQQQQQQQQQKQLPQQQCQQYPHTQPRTAVPVPTPAPIVSYDFSNKPVVKIDYSNLPLTPAIQRPYPLHTTADVAAPHSAPANIALAHTTNSAFNFNIGEPVINIDLSNMVTEVIQPVKAAPPPASAAMLSIPNSPAVAVVPTIVFGNIPVVATPPYAHLVTPLIPKSVIALSSTTASAGCQPAVVPPPEPPIFHHPKAAQMEMPFSNTLTNSNNKNHTNKNSYFELDEDYDNI